MNAPGTLGGWEDRPCRNPDADLTSVPLDSRAVFLLTRIDGSTSIADLCEISGLTGPEAVELLTQLRAAGLITIEKAPPRPPPRVEAPQRPTGSVPRVPTAPAAPAARPLPRTQGTQVAAGPAHVGPRREDILLLRRYGRFGHVPAAIFRKPGAPRFGAFQFDKREALEQCDLTLEQRKEILFLYYNGENLDHFEYFDIEPTNDRKELRNAYFAFSKRFHPDTYFRKNLGSYEEKLHTIFKFANELNDKLQADDSLREAYYRVVKGRNDLFRAGLEAERTMREAEVAAQEAETAAQEQVAAESRKVELTQRLADRQKARRERTDFNPMTAQLDKAEQYYNDGMKQYQDQKFVQAANSLQLALTFDPRNDTYKQTFEKVNEKAKQVRAEQLWKQGDMHAQLGQNREALAYFRQALEFWRRHDYLIRTAESMLELNDDLNVAAELARAACDAAPQKVDYLLTLGKIYETANLTKRALATYERATKIDPQNDHAKKALKALKRL